jgi:hypothetical protein
LQNAINQIQSFIRIYFQLNLSSLNRSNFFFFIKFKMIFQESILAQFGRKPKCSDSSTVTRTVNSSFEKESLICGFVVIVWTFVVYGIILVNKNRSTKSTELSKFQITIRCLLKRSPPCPHNHENIYPSFYSGQGRNSNNGIRITFYE